MSKKKRDGDEDELSTRRRCAQIDAELQRLIDLHESTSDEPISWTMSGSIYQGLVAWIDAHPEPVYPNLEARYHMKRFDESHRYGKHEKGQQSLFDPSAMVPLSTKAERGEGKADRRSMGRLKLREAVRAKSVRDEAHMIENDNWREDSDYWNSRIPAYETFEEDLTDVEKRVFGWQPDVDDSEQDGLDEAAG